MRIKEAGMKRANELMLDRNIESRSPEVQKIMSEVFQELVQEPEYEYLRAMQRDFACSQWTIKRKPIKNFGTGAALETIGLLGIFLTQFSDAQIAAMLEINRRRKAAEEFAVM